MASTAGVVEVKGWLKVWRPAADGGSEWEKMMCHASPDDGFQGWAVQSVDKGPPVLHLALPVGGSVAAGPAPSVTVPTPKHSRTFWVQGPEGNTIVCLQAPNTSAAEQWREVLASLLPPAPRPPVNVEDRASVVAWAKAVAAPHAHALPPGVAGAIAQEWARRKAGGGRGV